MARCRLMKVFPKAAAFAGTLRTPSRMDVLVADHWSQLEDCLTDSVIRGLSFCMEKIGVPEKSRLFNVGSLSPST